MSDHHCSLLILVMLCCLNQSSFPNLDCLKELQSGGGDDDGVVVDGDDATVLKETAIEGSCSKESRQPPLQS